MQPNAELRERFFLVLVALFVAALVSCNLIAQKFVSVPFFGHEFQVSAGILPYPLTFLVTDILSEVYGRRRANQVVIAGLIASVFVVAAVWLGQWFTALSFSPVTDDQFTHVFGRTGRLISASMVAYLFAQLIDIRLFHFWKRLTNGRHFWLRNNASTILSQLVDSTLVIVIIFVGDRSWPEMGGMIVSAWSFKALWALLDTPFAYLVVYWLRRSGVEPAAANE